MKGLATIQLRKRMLHPDDATGSDLEIPWEVHAFASGITEVTFWEGVLL